ncbi:MAG TPA: hypothetical protein DGT21_24405 [Armatimonadetes bacterium]|jgi:hypothetical protein|nr:hypothetical protein [Armatimonadota bacterium]
MSNHDAAALQRVFVVQQRAKLGDGVVNPRSIRESTLNIRWVYRTREIEDHLLFDLELNFRSAPADEESSVGFPLDGGVIVRSVWKAPDVEPAAVAERAVPVLQEKAVSVVNGMLVEAGVGALDIDPTVLEYDTESLLEDDGPTRTDG